MVRAARTPHLRRANSAPPPLRPAPAPAHQHPPPLPFRRYGLSPDDTVPGLVNIFTMLPTGQPTGPVAAVKTKDNECTFSLSLLLLSLSPTAPATTTLTTLKPNPTRAP